MTHTTKQILVVITGAAVIALGVYKITNYTEPMFKNVDIDYSNTVINQTSKPYLDTIVHVGLSSVGVKDVSVVVKPIDAKVRDSFEGGGSYSAYITVQGDIYTINIDDLSKIQSVEVIAHEIVHLQQYEVGDLVVKNKITPVWKGEEFDISSISYEDRPWEKEAFRKQGAIAKKMESILY